MHFEKVSLIKVRISMLYLIYVLFCKQLNEVGCLQRGMNGEQVTKNVHYRSHFYTSHIRFETRGAMQVISKFLFHYEFQITDPKSLQITR